MQKTSTAKIPVGNRKLSYMMVLTESEVRFFPKLDELKEHIKNYNYSMYTKNVLIEKLTELQEQCKLESLNAYAEGIVNLVKNIQ